MNPVPALLGVVPGVVPGRGQAPDKAASVGGGWTFHAGGGGEMFRFSPLPP